VGEWVRAWVLVWAHGSGRLLGACSLTKLASNVPPYCHLWCLWLHYIFRHCLVNGTICGKKLWKTKRVFWFSVQLSVEPFLILRRTQRCIVIIVKTSLFQVPVILVGFSWNLNFSDRFSRKKKLKYQGPWKSVQWKPSSFLTKDGQIGRQTWWS
jgi:hypothetical protein